MAWAFSGRLEISSFRAFIDREETINKTNGDRHLMMLLNSVRLVQGIQGEKKHESIMINRCVRRRVYCFGFGFEIVAHKLHKILSFIELVLIAKYTAAVSTLSFCLI